MRGAVVLLGTLVLAAGLAGSVAAIEIAGHGTPTIDDIAGVWSAKGEGREFDLFTGEKYKFKGKATLTITKLDSETVNVHYDGDDGVWDDVAHYAAGVLVECSSNDDTLGSWASVYTLVIHGRPPKLTGDGRFIEFDLDEGWLDVGSVSAKRVGGIF